MLLYLFIKISFFAYFLIFVCRSLIKHVFDTYLKWMFAKYIDDQCKKWVQNSPKDEWILGNRRIFKERENILHENDDIQYIVSDNDGDNDEDIDVKNLSILKRILNSVTEENTTSFSITIRTLINLVFIKTMFGLGHINEVIVGVLIGMIAQIIHIGFGLGNYMKEWYFGSRKGLNIHEIIVKKNKIPAQILFIFPLAVIFLLNLIKANVYSRVLGEWVMDLSHLYLYIAQIFGFLITQNFVRIIDYTNHSASILFLVVIYIVFSFIV